MKILLLGKTGQVGFELHRTLSPVGAITAPVRAELNLMNQQAVGDCLSKTKPDLIVNAAAWTAVDAAEDQLVEARRLNAGLPQQLAEYAAASEVRLVHYSSDYVYAGDGDQPWEEGNSCAPLSIYGQTKLEGDLAIEQSGADYLIFRTSWVYSARGSNFMKTLLRLAESKSELSVVADQVGVPTPARLIAQITCIALCQNLDKGIYHLAPRGETSWHGFAEEIFRQSGHTVKTNPIPASEYPLRAPRPLNSRLRLDKLEGALNIELPDWRSQLELTINEYLEKA